MITSLSRSAFAVHLLLLSCVSASAQTLPDRAALSMLKTAHLADGVGALSTCPKTSIVLPYTGAGVISYGSCKDLIGLRGDYFAISVSAGQTIEVRLRRATSRSLLTCTLGAARA